MAPTGDDLFAKLSEPFPPDVLGWKPQTVKGNRALAVAYIDARHVQNRLDRAVGPENWWADYHLLGDGKEVVCRLTLLVDGREVTKVDVGCESEQSDSGDRLKAAFSDALKRAAVQWGVGRYLYYLPSTWCDFDPVTRQIVTPPTLPRWAVPPAKKEAAKPEVPTASPEADPRRKALSDAMKSSGWAWSDAMKWLCDSYPGEAVKYTATTRFGDIEPARIDQLIRAMNTAAVKDR